jgi:pimeloyl-ACP methyl ester carboxylesterase
MPLTEDCSSMVRSADRRVGPVRARVARCPAFLAAGRRAGGSLVAALATAVLLAALPGAAFGEGQILRDVVFTDYGDRSSNQEVVRRMLSPLAAARLGRELARSGRALTGQPVDLSTERYVVYLPSQRSASGYGLLVFVPPWPDARIPPGWAAVLDRFGLIFVSAARSGNEESALARREPLALLAAENAIRRYPVDLERVYVAGFSGGSRIALRLAVGYPDLFRGAILNAGSDPIGSAEVPLPPRELFLQFQNSARVVYVTGERDGAHAVDDLMSVRSLRHWCVFSADSIVEPRLGHEVAAASALSRALSSLTASARPDAAKVAACRSAIDSALDAALQKVASMIEDGRNAKARQLLKDADEQFGGLAAPRSLALASKL